MLIFNHLPKCGGASVIELMRARFGPRFEVLAEPVDYARVAEILESNRLDCVSGHFINPPPRIREMMLARGRLFSLTRDPADRFESIHAYLKSFKVQQSRDLATSHDVNAFFEAGMAPMYQGDSQLGQLTLSADVLRPRGGAGLRNFFREHYFLIGAVEKLDVFVDRLAEAGLVEEAYTPHANRATTEKQALSEANRTRLKTERCRGDAALHRAILGMGALANPSLPTREP